MKTTVVLNAAERDSHVWKKVALEIGNRMAEHRKRVENPHVPEADRLGLCWRILELKELLTLGDEPAKPQQPDE